MKPSDFVSKYYGQIVDYDGAYSVQCVDGFKVFCAWAGIPVKATPNNWANGYWLYKDQLGYSEWFEYITDANALRDGDWCIWDKGSSCPSSHIAMYYKGQFFGERQGGNNGFISVSLEKDIMGALRWKGWSMDNYVYGVNYRTFEGADLVVYKGYDYYDLYIVSAGENELLPITDFDSQELLITAAVNAGYFEMRTDAEMPYGTHYGVEQAINGVDLAPKKDGLLVFYETLNDGVNWDHSDKYWYSLEEVKFGITPYSVIRHNGQTVVGAISTDYGSKEFIANEQTMIVKKGINWFFVCSRNKVMPSIMLRYAEYMDAEEAVLMDSGGSTQMMAYDASTKNYEKIIYTGRKLPNVAVIAKKAPTGHSEPIESIPDEDEDSTIVIEDPSENEVITDMDNNVKTLLPDKVYDVLKWICLLLIPGIAWWIGQVGADLGIENWETIVKVLNASATLLGMLIGVSTVQYNRGREK